MIYSIGYQRITVEQLITILKKNKIEHLLDVRSKPYDENINQQEISIWHINKPGHSLHLDRGHPGWFF